MAPFWILVIVGTVLGSIALVGLFAALMMSKQQDAAAEREWQKMQAEMHKERSKAQ